MKTKSLFVAAVAIMMAACSETDNISVQNTAQQAETAVSFDTYTAKALTRAGAVGEITTKEDLQVNNFGVFAYYTNGTAYYTTNKNENDYRLTTSVCLRITRREILTQITTPLPLLMQVLLDNRPLSPTSCGTRRWSSTATTGSTSL